MTNYVDYKINDSGQYVFDKGDYVLVSGDDEYKQRLIGNLKTFLSEWFADTTQGMDYIGVLFNKLSTKQARIKEVSRVITETEGTKKIISIDETVQKDIRKANMKIKVLSENNNIIEVNI